MPAPDTPLTGDALLAPVTDAMVALHKRYHSDLVRCESEGRVERGVEDCRVRR